MAPVPFLGDVEPTREAISASGSEDRRSAGPSGRIERALKRGRVVAVPIPPGAEIPDIPG